MADTDRTRLAVLIDAHNAFASGGIRHRDGQRAFGHRATPCPDVAGTPDGTGFVHVEARLKKRRG